MTPCLVVEHKRVREVAAMANFNLNKNQSLNGALRVVYMEEEGGNFVALGEGDRN